MSELGHFGLEVFPSKSHAHFDGVQVLDMFVRGSLDDLCEEWTVPFVGQQSLLEDLVKDGSVDEGRRRLACCLDPVLQNGTTHTTKGICDDSRGDELVGV